ncbi:MAG TPA: OB-fold domain-containing protein [Acidimicrobiales bacterium]|nr:OB-fold domain-containing protein [Acidimicrobiales bacterium]
MTGDAAPAPVPVPDEESGPFWAGLGEGRIVLQACPACGRRRFPRMPACPYCGAEGGSDVESPGTGTVYSWVRVQRVLTPAMAGQVPYCIATVDLDGGGRMHGRLEPASEARIGLRVEPRFVPHDGWTELRFGAAAAGEAFP